MTKKDTTIRYCEYCGASSEETRIIYYKKKNYLCNKHRIQMERYGYFYKSENEKNDIIILENLGYAEMILRNLKGVEIARVKIDINQIDRVSKYKWRLEKYHAKYAVTTLKSKKSKHMYLHRFILNNTSESTDHINGDTFDNRLVNLRACTYHENGMNLALDKNNKSGVTGVYQDKASKKWISTIKYNYKHIYLGSFIRKEEAIKIRKEAESKYFGAFAPCISRKENYMKVRIIKTSKLRDDMINIDTLIGKVFNSIGYNEDNRLLINNNKLSKDEIGMVMGKIALYIDEYEVIDE